MRIAPLLAAAVLSLAGAAAAARDDGWIVFVRNCGFQCSRLYAVRPDGSGLHRISPVSAAYAPAVSPDGTKIAFTRGPGREQLWVMGADGSAPHRLARNAGWPAWSPDGRRIAFERDGAVWVARADGSGARAVTHGRAPDHSPAWAPGHEIAFGSDRGTTTSVWAIRADGSHLRRLTGDAAYGPAWSPDGRTLAYWYEQGPLHLLDTRTGRSRVVPDSGAMGAAASFSPDGTRVVFASTVELRDRLVIVRLSDWRRRVLPLPPAGSNDVLPTWARLEVRR